MLSIHDPEYYKRKKKREIEKHRISELRKEFKRMKIPHSNRFGVNDNWYNLPASVDRLLEHDEAKKLSKSYKDKKQNARMEKVKQFNKISYYVVYVKGQIQKY